MTFRKDCNLAVRLVKISNHTIGICSLPSGGHVFSGVLPALDRLNMERNSNVHLISPSLADLFLSTSHISSLPQGIRFPVGFIAYGAPEFTFGSEFVLHSPSGATVVVPTDLIKGESNVALVAIYFRQANANKRGGILYIDFRATYLISVRNFPVADGLYITNPDTTVPNGSVVSDSYVARRLKRLPNGFAGFITRVADQTNNAWKDLESTYSLSAELGLIVEIPRSELHKFE